MRRKSKPTIRGQVVMVDLVSLQPNSWNPNEMPEHILEGIRLGFRADGWLASQALTVWGTDETGARRDVIIDGEHRWLCGLDVGLKEGPAVVLERLSERKAKALTIKLGKLRGKPEQSKLASLMADLADLAEETAVALGFLPEELTELQAIAAEQLAKTETAAAAALEQLQQATAPPSGFTGDTWKKRRQKGKAKEQHMCVVIDCKDEDHQREVIELCDERGWKCRALI